MISRIDLHVSFIAGKYIFIGFAILFMNCSSVAWRNIEPDTTQLPYIFDQSNLIGTGLKYSNGGYYGKSCLSDIKTISQGGILEIEFYKIGNDFFSNDRLLNTFVHVNQARVSNFNLQKGKPVSFVVSIKIKDRHAILDEETLKFKNNIVKIIESDDIYQFYDACGTDLIYSIRYESAINLFISYYITNDREINKIEEIIKKRISNIPGNTFQINIFNDLIFTDDTYYSLQIGTDSLFNPIEFPFARIHGKSINDLLNRSIHSILNSHKGTVMGYEKMAWKNLGPLKSKLKDQDFINLSESSHDQLYKTINVMEQSVRDFNIKYIQAKEILGMIDDKYQKLFVNSCINDIIENKAFVNWDNLNVCRNSIRKIKSLTLSDIPECKSIINAIEAVNSNDYCSHLPDFSNEKNPYLNKKSYMPLVLSDWEGFDLKKKNLI